MFNVIITIKFNIFALAGCFSSLFLRCLLPLSMFYVSFAQKLFPFLTQMNSFLSLHRRSPPLLGDRFFRFRFLLSHSEKHKRQGKHLMLFYGNFIAKDA